MWVIRTKITKKRKIFSVLHKLCMCEGSFAHCACDYNSPAKNLTDQFQSIKLAKNKCYAKC